MEIALFTGLAGISYLLSKMDASQQSSSANKTVASNEVRHSEIVDGTTTFDATSDDVYASHFASKARAHEQSLANASFQNTDPITGIRHDSDDDDGRFLLEPKQSTDLPYHNNMVPFFKGTPKQDVDGRGLNQTLERFTGVNDTVYRKKAEISNMFEPSKDLAFVNGSPNQTDTARDRIRIKDVRHNILPFQQVRVGVGLGTDSVTPSGGFQQLEVNEFARPKNIDDLRVKSNPKTTFEGRTIPGKGPSAPPHDVTPFEKNRPDTTFDILERSEVPTKADVTGPKQQGLVNAKATSRSETDNNEHFGGAGDYRTQEQTCRYADPEGPLKNKVIHNEADAINPRSAPSDNAADDYGKDAALISYLDVSGERADDSPDDSPLGIATTIVKAIAAPVLDALRVTRKDATIELKRSHGNVSIQIPMKLAMHDPYDIPKTTIRETTENASDPANVAGPVKATVNDPNDVARTTIKETTIHDAQAANLTGPAQVIAYYDPEEVARTTVRDTTDDVHYPVMSIQIGRGKVHDENDTAKTTVRETLTSATIAANIASLLGKPGAYFDDPVALRATNKQFTAQHEHYSAADRGDTTGYTGPVSPYATDQPLPTNRAGLAQQNFISPAASTRYKKPVSIVATMGHRTSASREETLRSRTPTKTGAKQYVSNDDAARTTRARQSLPDADDHVHTDPYKLFNSEIPESTHLRSLYDESPRFVVDVTAQNSQAGNNPFIQPSFFTSAAIK